MTEPRMRARQKGQQFTTAELEALLHAYGTPSPFLPSTLTVLDELITSYIIEICHSASLSAQLAHRAKIKIDDFRFAFRNDAKKLGRMQELSQLNRLMADQRKAFDQKELVGGEWEEKKVGVGRGRGRKRKAVVDGEGDGEAEGAGAGVGSETKRGRKKGRKRKKGQEVGEEDEED